MSGDPPETAADDASVLRCQHCGAALGVPDSVLASMRGGPAALDRLLAEHRATPRCRLHRALNAACADGRVPVAPLRERPVYGAQTVGDDVLRALAAMDGEIAAFRAAGVALEELPGCVYVASRAEAESMLAASEEAAEALHSRPMATLPPLNRRMRAWLYRALAAQARAAATGEPWHVAIEETKEGSP